VVRGSLSPALPT